MAFKASFFHYKHPLRNTRRWLPLCVFLLSASASAATTEQLPEQELVQLRQAVENARGFSDRYAAEVWLVGMDARLQKFIPDRSLRLKLLQEVYLQAQQANLSPQLVLAVIEVESGFDHYAVSTAGAQGLMQVMPFWKKNIGNTQDNLIDVNTNLRYGCAILSHYLKVEKSDLIKALARYNGSVGQTWYPERVILAWERNWFVN
ncbi:MAG TPA: transglycosylase SLT domain-containing protein [Pseudomonadales bacterium]|nr:transglycosylase SLT domain-containing protein [Pseudomonadales bacterium]